MSATLYLIRHGATESTAAQRVCGSTDVPLSPRGEEEMLAVARYFEGKELTGVFSSPLQRARNPAAALAASRNITLGVIDELAELHFGAWEGRSLTQVAMRWPIEFAQAQMISADYTFPGGENVGAFQARAIRALARIQNEIKGPAAVYTHGGILRMMVGSLNGLSLAAAKALSFSTGSITVLEWNGTAHHVAVENCYEHLNSGR